MTALDSALSTLRPVLRGRDITDPAVQQDLIERKVQGSRDWAGIAIFYEVTGEGIAMSELRSGCVLRTIRWDDLTHQTELDLGGHP